MERAREREKSGIRELWSRREMRDKKVLGEVTPDVGSAAATALTQLDCVYKSRIFADARDI